MKKVFNWLFTNYKGEKVAWYYNVFAIVINVLLLGLAIYI